MIKDIEKSIIKKYRKEIWSKFIKAIKDYELIQENDNIMVCISGGKDSFLLAKLIQEGYIKLNPKIRMPEHEEVKSYMIISCDNFTPNKENPYYRDCTVTFDIICHLDYWDIGDYRLRPLKIVGYIDGLLNNAKLSGIGELNFLGCNELILNEDLAGYSLSYRAIHGNDDRLPPRDE